jgi:hypothetical protein
VSEIEILSVQFDAAKNTWVEYPMRIQAAFLLWEEEERLSTSVE